jgi:hypothetical protein
VVQQKGTARRMCAPLSGVTSGFVALLPFGRVRRTDPADLNPGVAIFP